MKRENKNPFKGRQFTAEVILWAVRWYLQFPISYRDLERMLADRGVQVDHTTMYRWVQASPPSSRSACAGISGLTTALARRRDIPSGQGEWRYLYRAVDGTGQTIDFLLSPKRDAVPPGASSGSPEAAAYRQSADHHGRQECRLPAPRDEAGGRALALCPAPAGEVAQQHGRAGSPPHQAAGPSGAGLQELHDGSRTIAGSRPWR